MKNRIVVEGTLVFNIDNKIILKELRSRFINGISYLDYIKSPGVYFIHNKVTNKYYVGSSVNMYYRVISLHISTSHRPQIYRYHSHRFLTENNLDEFEVIFLRSDINNIRIKEERYIKLLESFKLEYGYNLTKSGTFGAPVRNTNIKDKTWVTNCNGINFCIEKDEEIPEGFYPGRRNKSNVKVFFDTYNPELRNRNSKSELLKIKLPRNYVFKLDFWSWRSCSMHIHKMIDNLKKFYNIELVFF